MNFSSGLRGGHNQRQGRGYGGRFAWGSTKHLGIFYAYCMDSAPFKIFENQVIPTGLDDISKSSRPNLATTRVFLWEPNLFQCGKKTKRYKPFSKFQDFCRRVTNKMYFEETTPGVFIRIGNSALKAIGGLWNTI